MNIGLYFDLSLMNSLQSLRYIYYKDPCDAAIPGVACFGLRFPATVCMASLAALQFGMIVERVVALWKRKCYETYGYLLGCITAVICVATSAILTAWAMMQMDFRREAVYCSVGTPEIANRIKVFVLTLSGTDGVTLIGIALLFAFNVAASKRKFFDLRSSYQLNENISVIRILLPVSMFQAVCHFSFSVANLIVQTNEASYPMITYRTIFASTYIIPYYTMITPLMMVVLLRKLQRERAAKLRKLAKSADNECVVYFTEYSKMWAKS
ncbi:integral membrane protein [Oesophagostomum dentatum]|uniref:Integral membrane protein n=1 Tax=Oesophagostomum dentatum TaxID=61180 RepID=A0A0B1TPI7_OESDE|nr:integral membrane protein [Oesophagostomum dentatum]